LPPSKKNVAIESWKLIFLTTLGLVIILAVISNSMKEVSHLSMYGEEEKSMFDELGRYILRNYDEMRPMANFLAGVGGYWGVPLWLFYVNRGQGVTSFGVANKDHPIAKFNTAEKAYQLTPFTGFRTFVKGTIGGKPFNHMPFFPIQDKQSKKPKRDMMIGMNEMEIEETDHANHLKTNVLYYTGTDEDFPCLIRRTTFKNLHDKEEMSLEVLDGLAQLIPSGLNEVSLDTMGRTMEAWMNVYNVQENFLMPFFHISQGTADTATIQIINDGHFALAFVEGETDDDGLAKLLPFVVDPAVVFNADTSLVKPSNFFNDKSKFKDFMKTPQGTTSRTPCAYAGTSFTLPPGKSLTVTSVYGHADNLDQFVNTYAPIIQDPSFVDRKRTAAKEIVGNITSLVETSTSSTLFDLYIKQDFLDNTLRGGLPVPLGTSENKKIYHTFSRIHGDIERDYNYFQLDTTYFSQGPGNFRDVTQNRRLDVFVRPEVGDFNVRMFLSFIQADGYNPLTVASTFFRVDEDKADSLIAKLDVSEDHVESMKTLLTNPFRPGQLFSDIAKKGITYGVDREDLLNEVIEAADQSFAAAFMQNGYWAGEGLLTIILNLFPHNSSLDHWTYILDLVDNYLSIFPDYEESLLWDAEPVPFYFSPAYVKDRKHRFTLVTDPATGKSQVYVYNAVGVMTDPDFPHDLAAEMGSIWADKKNVGNSDAGGWWQRNADEENYAVPVITKMLMLSILKFSTLDVRGMGIEMEGGKPGWNDAMNGLPGIFGSGMPETYEMLKLLRYLREALEKYGRDVTFPEEFHKFILSLDNALETWHSSDKDDDANLAFWDSANTAREAYRASVFITFTGIEVNVTSSEMISRLGVMEKKTLHGIERALETTDGMSPTYFAYECTDYEIITNVTTYIKVKAFKTKTLPMFLEGPTRYLKIVDDSSHRKKTFELVKSSDLYDSPLQMYTISESLSSMPQNVGRMMAFAAGWLENQSVWLHMSYKYYLELLRAGLYEQFFGEIKTGLVPFMDNEIYGRSPLEASSFIVSSVFPDSKIHGTGFLARLSGTTAEFMSIWSIMMAGSKPFELNKDGDLELKFSPVLPGWLFTDEGTVSFVFLGKVKVVYHNPKKEDSWTLKIKKSKLYLDDGSELKYDGSSIPSEGAHLVRDGNVVQVDLFF
jgi:hypothetical protein